MAQRAHVDHAHGLLRSLLCGRREDGEKKLGEIEVTCRRMSEDAIWLCKVCIAAYLEHWFQNASRILGS